MRYILSLLALLATFTAVAQQEEQSVAEQAVAVEFDNMTLWERGNQSYIDGDYAAAVNAYQAIENRGYSSSRLYYNMGNAYYKQGQIGRAILYYNRALVVSPSMEDAKHNLEIAEAFAKDKIAVVPEFFLNRWMRTLRSAFSCNVWGGLSVAMLAIAIAFGLIFLLGSQIKVRKSGFYGAVVALLLFVVVTIFAVSASRDILDRSAAIVMSSAISVKSSPDRAATDIFVIHEGTKVTISSEVDGWCEVTIADGKKGWTESSHLERI